MKKITHLRTIREQPEKDLLPMAGVRQITGGLDARGLKIGIVASRYNSSCMDWLVASAVERLCRLGVRRGDILVVRVPGGYEIPSVLEILARRGRHAAFIALGVVMKGETDHDTIINVQTAHSLAAIARQYRVPVIDGIVTANTDAQALVRCDPRRMDRGGYAARAAVEMACVFRTLRAGKGKS